MVCTTLQCLPVTLLSSIALPVERKPYSKTSLHLNHVSTAKETQRPDSGQYECDQHVRVGRLWQHGNCIINIKASLEVRSDNSHAVRHEKSTGHGQDGGSSCAQGELSSTRTHYNVGKCLFECKSDLGEQTCADQLNLFSRRRLPTHPLYRWQCVPTIDSQPSLARAMYEDRINFPGR